MSRKRLCISQYFCIIMPMIKSSDSLVIIESTSLSILCSHFLYFESFSFIDSSYTSVSQVSKFIPAFKNHMESFGSYFQRLKIFNHSFLIRYTGLFGMRFWFSGIGKKESSKSTHLIQRKRYIIFKYHFEFSRGKRMV